MKNKRELKNFSHKEQKMKNMYVLKKAFLVACMCLAALAFAGCKEPEPGPTLEEIHQATVVLYAAVLDYDIELVKKSIADGAKLNNPHLAGYTDSVLFMAEERYGYDDPLAELLMDAGAQSFRR